VITAIFMHACPRVYEERASIPNGDRLTFIAATSARARARAAHVSPRKRTRACLYALDAAYVTRGRALHPMCLGRSYRRCFFLRDFFLLRKLKFINVRCIITSRRVSFHCRNWVPRWARPSRHVITCQACPRRRKNLVMQRESRATEGVTGGGAETGRFARAREEYFTTKLFIIRFRSFSFFFFISFINELRNRLQNRSASTG